MYKVENGNIYITRGDTAAFTLNIDGYTAAEGDTLTFSVKKNCNDAQALITKDIDPTDKTFTVEHEDTATLDFGDYFYDVQLRREDGTEVTYDTVIIPHTFTVGAEVTW
jgi:hypothetical protein